MTPLATRRRLRRHGRAVALTTAAAALAGIAGASMAFQVDQDGTAAAAATEVVAARDESGPALAPPLPDLTAVGERVADALGAGTPSDEDLAREPGPATDAVPTVVTDLLPVLGPAAPSPGAPGPAAETPTPGPVAELVGSLPLGPLLGPAAPLPVQDALQPALDAADDVLGALPVAPPSMEVLPVDVAAPACEALRAVEEIAVGLTAPLLPVPPAEEPPCLGPAPTEPPAPAVLEPVRTGLLGG